MAMLDGQPEPGSRHDALPVAYVTGTYPLLTTTFIDREIRLLRSWGTTVDIISLRRPTASLSPDQVALAASTTYARPVAVSQLARRHGHFVRHRPGPYFRTLVTLVAAATLVPR